MTYQLINQIDPYTAIASDKSGMRVVIKAQPTPDEIELLKELSLTALPEGTQNVQIPYFISADPAHLLPGMIGDSCVVMEEMKGVPLSRWEKPIAREDWENLAIVMAFLNEKGMHHGDLKEEHLFVREENGHTCFGIIDWGAQKYGQRLKGEDLDALQEIEDRLIEKGLLARDPDKARRPERRNWRSYGAEPGSFELE